MIYASDDDSDSDSVASENQPLESLATGSSLQLYQ